MAFKSEIGTPKKPIGRHVKLFQSKRFLKYSQEHTIQLKERYKINW